MRKSRNTHTADEDQAELLRLQSEFLSGQQRPAAKATRIRPSAPRAPSKPSEQPNAPPTQAPTSAPEPAEGLLPGILGIVSDVQEKPVSEQVTAPSPPKGGTAFPKAIHRKLSKFALSRKQPPASLRDAAETTETKTAASAASTITYSKRTAAASAAPAAVQANNTQNGNAVAIVSEQPSQDSVPAASVNIPTMGMDVGPADKQRIDEENRQLVDSMSPAEVEEAKQELLSRLSPSAQAFLAKRAAAKSNRPAASGQLQAAASFQPVTANHSIQGGSAVSAGTAGKTGPRQQDSTSVQRLQSSTAERDTGANSNDPHLVGAGVSSIPSRLRFSLEGRVVGLKEATAQSNGPGSDQQVLQRDLLRQSEGTSPEGYTLQEACIMTRSSLPKQRVLALRIISAVLTAARPQPSHHDAAGALVRRQVDLPFTVQETAAPEAHVTWLEVWEYAVQDIQVTTVLRLLMDDSHLPVMTAAAEALAVLVGPGPEEEELWAAADCNPKCGCPAVPWRYLVRPHAVGAWVNTPVDKAAPAPLGPGLVEEQPPDDGKTGTLDPLIGLLDMQVLERISFLLRSPAAAAATSPLLAILQAYARAGADAARAIWQCPGILKALQGLLQSPAADAASDDKSSYLAAALATVRLLAASSSQLFQAVLSSGLLMHAQRALALAPEGNTSMDAYIHRLSLQVEALHIWRICADRNEAFMHLDDAYSAICCLLIRPSSSSLSQLLSQRLQTNPPPVSESQHDNRDESAASQAMTHQAQQQKKGQQGSHGSKVMSNKAQLLQKLQLEASCQSYLLLGSLVRHAIRQPARAMLSPGSATALVNEALGWLQPDTVQTLHTMLQQHVVHQGERHSHVTRATALPVLLSALAAVLNFLEAQITARQAAGDIASVTEALTTSQLLNSNSSKQVSPIVHALLTHSVGPANNSCGQPKSSMSTCELVLAVSALSQTLERHQGLPTSVPNMMHSSILRSLSVEVARAAQPGLVEIQPWTASWQHWQLPRQLLLLHALEHMQMTSLSAHYAHQAFSAALALPKVLPPGAEAIALRAVSTAFQVALLGPILNAAFKALQTFKFSSSSLARAAAGCSFKQMQSMHSVPDKPAEGAQQHSMLSTTSIVDAESSQLPSNSTGDQTSRRCQQQPQQQQQQHEQQLSQQQQHQQQQQQSQQQEHQQQQQQQSQQHEHQLSQQQWQEQHQQQQSQQQEHQHQQQQQQKQKQKQQQLPDLLDVLYPLEPLPDVQLCGQRLLQGYSAAWLGLVPAAPHIDKSPDSDQADVTSPRQAVLQPVGSRLPLPSDYYLVEIVHPSSESHADQPQPPTSNPSQSLATIPEEDSERQQQAAQSKAAAAAAAPSAVNKSQSRAAAAAAAAASGAVDDSAALSVGCALLLELGMAQISELSIASKPTPGVMLRHAMDLVFSPEAAAHADSSEELWYHPLVRWTLAALLHRWYQGQPDLSSITPEDAQKWTEHFAAVSYGDPLFALALSPLLSFYAQHEVQVIVLQTLADEKCLHLMPSLDLAILGRAAYSKCNSDSMPSKHVGSGQQQVQQVLHELHQSRSLQKCQDTNSMIKDL